MKPIFISIPHSGEQVPEEASWLNNLPEEVLMCDVDRYVDDLYKPALDGLKLPSVQSKWHRYAADLNRLPEDVDSGSVKGSLNPLGSFPLGLHWQKTTQDNPLMHSPISFELHQKIIEKYYSPFHHEVEKSFEDFEKQGFKNIYHIDAHSMPSVGTAAHKDPGETRPDIVVSDVNGTSCEKRFSELVMSSYQLAGFKVAYNWPYQGGRITQKFGHPDVGRHTLQVEMSRALYMDEVSKHQKLELMGEVQNKLQVALENILLNL